jgi:hypothetical protein
MKLAHPALQKQQSGVLLTSARVRQTLARARQHVEAEVVDAVVLRYPHGRPGVGAVDDGAKRTGVRADPDRHPIRATSLTSTV